MVLFYISHSKDIPKNTHMASPLAVLPAEPIVLVQLPLCNSIDFHGQDPVLNQPQPQPQIVSPIINKIENLSENLIENKIERTTESAVNDKIESPVEISIEIPIEIPVEKDIEVLQVDSRNAIQTDLQEAELSAPESPEIDHLDVNNPKVMKIISKKENLKIFKDFEKNTEKHIESAGLSMKTIGDALREQSVSNLTKVLMKLREKLEEVEDYDRNVRGDEFAAVLTLGNLHHEIFCAVLFCTVRCCFMQSCTVLCCPIWIRQHSYLIICLLPSSSEHYRSYSRIVTLTAFYFQYDPVWTSHKSLYLSFTLS